MPSRALITSSVKSYELLISKRQISLPMLGTSRSFTKNAKFPPLIVPKTCAEISGTCGILTSAPVRRYASTLNRLPNANALLRTRDRWLTVRLNFVLSIAIYGRPKGLGQGDTSPNNFS